MTINVLFLCTGNSARSILAEVLLNDLGGGRFRAYSAGSRPVGRVNPGAIHVLDRAGHSTEGLASKSWEEFSGTDAPPVDVVITVCDNVAGESCPVWNGKPATAHWGISDPAAESGSEDDICRAFDLAYERLRERVQMLVELEREDLNRERLMDINDRALESAPTD